MAQTLRMHLLNRLKARPSRTGDGAQGRSSARAAGPTRETGRPPATGITALAARARGPGGYYNIGNVLALGTALGVQVVTALTDAHGGSGEILPTIRAYLFGSPGATALTISILIFFASGEMYHRAWSGGFPPDRRCNWWGDFLAGIAALFLTVALAEFGDVLLAILSGLLLAAGKFGSALVSEDYRIPAASFWPKRFRMAVLASRVTAIGSLAFHLVTLVASGAAPAVDDLVLMPVMLVCYLLWARADFLLIPRPGIRVRIRGVF